MKNSMFKKTVFLLAALIAMSNQSYAAFIDVPASYPYSNAINYLQNNGILEGYSDGSFRPENSVNRAEFLKIIIEGSDISTDNSLTSPFNDIDQNAWYTKYVNKAYNEGWVIGYGDGSFRPAQTITKSESLKILGQVQKWQLATVNTPPYNDVSTGEWYTPYFAYAKEHNLLPEFSGNVFPQTLMSRATISEIIYRTLVQQPAPTTPEIIKPEEEPTIEQPTQDFGTIDSNSFSNISLFSKPPSTFYKDEIYIIEGEIKSGEYDEVTMIIQNTKTKTQEVLYANTDSGRFKLPLHFSSEGTYAFGIFPGNSGSTNIENIKVISLPSTPTTPSNLPQTEVSLSYKKDVTSIKLSAKTPDYLKKFRFEQNGNSLTYYSRQDLGEIPLNYRYFKNFKEGQVTLKTSFARASSFTPLIITGAFTEGGSYNFTAAEHTFITNEKEEISAEPALTINLKEKISFSGKALTKIKKVAYVQKPDGFVEEISLITTENTTTLPKGTSFTFNYSPTTKGRYIVEINNENAIASLNTPIYVGGIIPLIPDYQDLNERKYFKGTVDITSARNNLLTLLNDFREDHGLSPVKSETELNNLAQNHSIDMADNNFFGHINLQGLTPDDRRIAAGITTPVSENLAKDVSIEFAHYGLLRSPAHRLNIMNKNWSSVGLGIAENNGYLYISQEFAAPKITSADTQKFKEDLFSSINSLREDYSLNALSMDSDLSEVGATINNEVINNGQTLNNDLFSNTLKEHQISGVSQAIGRVYNAWQAIKDSIIEDETELLTKNWEQMGIDIMVDNLGIIHTMLILNK